MYKLTPVLISLIALSGCTHETRHLIKRLSATPDWLFIFFPFLFVIMLLLLAEKKKQ